MFTLQHRGRVQEINSYPVAITIHIWNPNMCSHVLSIKQHHNLKSQATSSQCLVYSAIIPYSEWLKETIALLECAYMYIQADEAIVHQLQHGLLDILFYSVSTLSSDSEMAYM